MNTSKKTISFVLIAYCISLLTTVFHFHPELIPAKLHSSRISIEYKVGSSIVHQSSCEICQQAARRCEFSTFASTAVLIEQTFANEVITQNILYHCSTVSPESQRGPPSLL